MSGRRLASLLLSCFSNHLSPLLCASSSQVPLPCGAPADRTLLGGKDPPPQGPPTQQALAQHGDTPPTLGDQLVTVYATHRP